MNIKRLTTLAFAGFLFAGALFTTGCEKSSEDKAADAIGEAKESMKDALN